MKSSFAVEESYKETQLPIKRGKKSNKPKGLRYKETEECRYWTVANVARVGAGGPRGEGKTIVVSQYKAKPHLLSLQKLNYATNPAGEFVNMDRNRCCFSLRGGRLNIYKKCGPQKKLNNISTKFNIIEWGLKEPAHYKRFSRVLNRFFRENGFKGRIIGLNSPKLRECFATKYSWSSGSMEKIREKVENPDWKAICSNYAEEFNKQLQQLMYPGVKSFDFKTWIKLDSSYSAFLRQPVGIKAILRKFAGTVGKKTTKEFMRVVKKDGDLNVLTELKNWKGLVSTDHLGKFLENRYSALNYWTHKRTRNFLRQFNSERRIAFLKDSFGEDFRSMYIKDTINAWESVKKHIYNWPLNVLKGGWKEMHDWITKESIKLANAPRDISYKEKWAEIDGLEIGEMKIQLPKKTSDLIKWGQQLNFCIGGKYYQDTAAKGEKLLFAVEKNDELTYCADITNGRLIQLHGHSNRPAEKNDREILVEELVKRHILGKIETYEEVPLPEIAP